MTKEEINKLEGRALDALVARKVLGWEFRKPTHGTCCTCQRCGRDQDECSDGCEFGEDFRSAFAVVEALKAKCDYFQLCYEKRVGWEFVVTMSEKGPFFIGLADSMPLAVCRGALQAAFHLESLKGA
jgi:hypothetical protein